MLRSRALSSFLALRLVLVRRGVFAGLGLALACLAMGCLALASGVTVGPALVTL